MTTVARVLYDSTGSNPVGVVLDGAVYRLQAITKMLGASGNQISSITDGDDERLQTEAKLAADGATQKVQMADGEGGTRLAYVDPDNRLLVSTRIPEAPTGTTAVSQTDYGDLAGNSSDDLDYVIPNGETLYIQYFSAGAQGGGGRNASSKVELWYDPLGTGSGMDLIAVAYMSNANYALELSGEYVGDGTKQMKLRRTRLDAGTREVFGSWRGYY